MDSQKPQKRCLTESRLPKVMSRALAIISEYVETELSRDMDQPKPEKQGKKKTERER